MTDPDKVLLALISYASDSGKPAVLKIRPQTISLLCAVGLIEEREDGHWITDLGRNVAFSPGRFSQYLPDVEKELMGRSATARSLRPVQDMSNADAQGVSEDLGNHQDLPASFGGPGD